MTNHMCWDDPEMRSFSLDVNGHRFRATWKLTGQDRMEVRSDYGSMQVNLGGRDPSVAARDALRTIVAAQLRLVA